MDGFRYLWEFSDRDPGGTRLLYPGVMAENVLSSVNGGPAYMMKLFIIPSVSLSCATIRHENLYRE